MPLLTSIAALLFAAVAVIDLSWAFPLFVFLLPAYLLRLSIPFPGLAGGLPTTLLEISFLALFLVWFFRRKTLQPTTYNLQPFSNWILPLVLFLTGATIGVLVSPDWRGGLGLWRAYFIEPVLFFFVAREMLRDEKVRERSFVALAAMLAVIGGLAIFQKITGWGIPNPVWQAAETRRVTAFFGYPNAIALYAVPVIILLAGRLAVLRRTLDIRTVARSSLYAVAVILGLVAIIFARSEGGAIAAAAGLLTLGLLHRRWRAAALIAVIAGCLTISLLPAARDWASGMAGFRDDSTSVRAVVWQESLTMLRDRPIFGAGLSGYRQTLEPYHLAKHIEIFMYPHNLVLNFWSETGLIGLAGFLWLLGLMIALNVRRMRADPDGWIAPAVLAAIAAILVHGLVDVPYLKNDLAFMFWLLAAL